MCAIRIGWAKRDISTTEPVNINGQMYLRISEGILDPITVTALVLDGGDPRQAAIFVSCDVTVINDAVVEQTRQKVSAADPSIPIDNIVLNATHTHSSSAITPTPEKSPDGKPIYSGEKYREFFTDKICEAVCQAWNTRSEGGIAYGYGFAVVGHSRRTVYLEDQSLANPTSAAPNGFGMMYGNTKKDSFSHYEAGADHYLNVMFTVDANKKLTGMIINVPCPSQTSEMITRLSADYWNDVREAVAAEFGPEVYILPQCAAAGDLAPRTLHYKEAQARRMGLKYGLHYDPSKARGNSPDIQAKSFAERKDIAERILLGVKDVYSWAMADIQTEVPVRHIAASVPLTRRIINEEDLKWSEGTIRLLESMLPDPEEVTGEEYRQAVTRYNSICNRHKTAVARREELKETPTREYIIHITQVGEIAFASNPFELYQDYMHRIQARSPFIQTFITQLAGASGQYLPTARGAANKGYSASIYCNQVGPEGGQELVEYTLGVLNRLKAEDEQ